MAKGYVKVDAAAQRADDAIMEMCAPAKMTPPEAVDFLERVIERCQAAVEALEEEHPELGNR